jgi:uncharacterized protein (DUF697 family)
VKLNARTLLSTAREFRTGVGDPRPAGVAGARELVPILARELRAGGRDDAVVEQRTEGISVLIWVGAPDEERLRAASRAGVPIVAVTDAGTVPYVLAENLVRVPAGQGFPVDEIAAAVANRLGDKATTLAARLPVLRPAVCKHLIDTYAKQNGKIAVAVFIPGVDMPILTLNQTRLVFRIALAYGVDLDRNRAGELIGLVGIVGAGFSFRAVARGLLDFVPVGGWAVKGAVAYTGTRTIGEAAVRFFEARL